MSIRNKISFFLIICSLLLLFPGLTNPILSLRIGTELPLIGEIIFYERVQNILETIKTLYEEDNMLVSILILVFSIIVPVAKALLLLLVLFFKKLRSRMSIYRFVYAIGKWSMADVFVVGIFLSYLSTQSTEGIDAHLESGFYYFSAYCIVSIVSIQVMSLEKNSAT